MVDLKEVEFVRLSLPLRNYSSNYRALLLGVRNGATPDDLFLDEVDHDEVLVGGVEEREQGEGEAGSDGEELANFLVDVRRSHLLAAGAIDSDDIGVACEEDR